MSELKTHVYGAATQPPQAKIKGRGQAQKPKQAELTRGEMKDVLDNLISELSNAIEGFRTSHGGTLSGVALSADLGAKYSLECAEYLQRKI